MSFIDFGWWPIFIPLITALLRKQYLDKAFKFLFLFIAYAVLNECIIFILRHAFEIKNTMPFLNLYLVVSFLLIGHFFSIILDGIVRKKLMLWFVYIVVFYFSLHILIFQGILKYPTLLGAISSLIYIVFSLIYLFNVRFDLDGKKMWESPLLWMNAGILIYFSSTLFYTILFNTFLEYSREFAKITVVYFSFFNTLFYILIAIGFWKTKTDRHDLVKT